MTAIGRPLQKPALIDGQPISVLLDNLKSPIDETRHRTRDRRSNTKYYNQTRELETPLNYHRNKLFINST